MGLLDTLVGAALNPFGVPSKGEWNLTQGSFSTTNPTKSVIFFFENKNGKESDQRAGLEQIADAGGRRKAVYEYPYQDGQALGDLGRKGNKYVFNIKFFGANYQLLLKDFIDVVINSNKSGTLTHPVLGDIPCGAQDYEFIHRHDESNAVTIKVTFLEDNHSVLALGNLTPIGSNFSLRGLLQSITNVQAFISDAIFVISAALLIPAAFKAALLARLSSIINQCASLLGQLAVTFSTDSQLQTLAANASVAGGLTNLNSGTSVGGNSIPPVFQVGFSSNSTGTSLLNSFSTNNQITPGQVVFQTNQIRSNIGQAIEDIQNSFSNSGSAIVLAYRQLVVDLQTAVETSISNSNATIIIYLVPYNMSMRRIAQLNGLLPDRQNDIYNLNPNLDSVNLVLKNSQVLVPSE
jgi:prophage DNA circulation protein